MITKITILKYRLNVCNMSISSKYGFQRGRRICLMACTAIANLKLLFPHTSMCCWYKARAHLESEHLLELLFPLNSCKNPILETFFYVACVPYYSGQALQNGFCPLNASNICQSSGDHVMLKTALIPTAT